MPFSSLIFLVIIAIWAAYLIQHWIRRRDHVATARSVDRFSEAMRVLERRQAIPRVESTSAKRSFLVGIARPAHPEVVVKRAHPAGAVGVEATRSGRSGSVGRVQRRSSARGRKLRLIGGLALFAAGIALAATGVLAWWAAAIGGVALLGSIGSVRASISRERRRRRSGAHIAGRRAASTATTPRRRSKRGSHRARKPAPAPVRAAAGRATAAEHPAQHAAQDHAAAASAQATRAPQLAPRQRPTPVVTAAAADAARSAARRPAIRRVTNAPVASSRVRGSAQLYVAPAARAGQVQRVAPTSASAPAAARAAAPAPTTAVYDVDAVTARGASRTGSADSGRASATAAAPTATSTATARPNRSPRPTSAAPQSDGTWQPIDVPAPTYTMKAKARRSGQVSGTTTTRDDARTATAPTSRSIADLPFDGNALALEEEFEELPAVRTG